MKQNQRNRLFWTNFQWDDLTDMDELGFSSHSLHSSDYEGEIDLFKFNTPELNVDI